MDGLGVEEQITFLFCSDLATTAAFYEEVLGFRLVLDQGSCRIVRRAGGGGYLGYCQRGVEEGGTRGLILTLVTQRVDEWYQYLLERGVTVAGIPEFSAEYGIYHFFFHDPDGYRLEIQRFEDSNWDRPAGF